ncbi:hypothetical protein ACIOWI_35665 [Streptomyces sp. NPDC087659]|uniref:hypothetical protein n=1 Tax=Streptomyces sp. NPDC087659 TaxID=3365801 RepID=UPI00382CD310
MALTPLDTPTSTHPLHNPPPTHLDYDWEISADPSSTLTSNRRSHPAIHNPYDGYPPPTDADMHMGVGIGYHEHDSDAPETDERDTTDPLYLRDEKLAKEIEQEYTTTLKGFVSDSPKLERELKELYTRGRVHAFSPSLHTALKEARLNPVQRDGMWQIDAPYFGHLARAIKQFGNTTGRNGLLPPRGHTEEVERKTPQKEGHAQMIYVTKVALRDALDALISPGVAKLPDRTRKALEDAGYKPYKSQNDKGQEVWRILIKFPVDGLATPNFNDQATLADTGADASLRTDEHDPDHADTDETDFAGAPPTKRRRPNANDEQLANEINQHFATELKGFLPFNEDSSTVRCLRNYYDKGRNKEFPPNLKAALDRALIKYEEKDGLWWVKAPRISDLVQAIKQFGIKTGNRGTLPRRNHIECVMVRTTQQERARGAEDEKEIEVPLGDALHLLESQGVGKLNTTVRGALKASGYALDSIQGAEGRRVWRISGTRTTEAGTPDHPSPVIVATVHIDPSTAASYKSIFEAHALSFPKGDPRRNAFTKAAASWGTDPKHHNQDPDEPLPTADAPRFNPTDTQGIVTNPTPTTTTDPTTTAVRTTADPPQLTASAPGAYSHTPGEFTSSTTSDQTFTTLTAPSGLPETDDSATPQKTPSIPRISAVDFAQECADFEQALGVHWSQDPGAQNAARAAVARAREVLRAAYPDHSDEALATAFTSADPTMSGQTQPDSDESPAAWLDALLATGSVRELMTAFYNALGAKALYEKDSSVPSLATVFKGALAPPAADSSPIGLQGLRGAAQLGLDRTALETYAKFLHGGRRAELQQRVAGDPRTSAQAHLFAPDELFALGNLAAHGTRESVKDSLEIVRSQSCRIERKPQRQATGAGKKSPRHYSSLGVPLTARERAFLTRYGASLSLDGCTREEVPLHALIFNEAGEPLLTDVLARPDVLMVEVHRSAEPVSLSGSPETDGRVRQYGRGAVETVVAILRTPVTAEAIRAGDLSAQHGHGHGHEDPQGPEFPLSWIEGVARFDLDRQSDWYREWSGAHSMPVIAGISGTTLRALRAFQWLNVPNTTIKDFTGALLGWMLPGQDHSLFEILRASYLADVTTPEVEHALNGEVTDLYALSEVIPPQLAPPSWLAGTATGGAAAVDESAQSGHHQTHLSATKLLGPPSGEKPAVSQTPAREPGERQSAAVSQWVMAELTGLPQA